MGHASFLLFLFFFLGLHISCLATRSRSSAHSPSSPWGPALAPKYHGSHARPPVYHHRAVPPALSPMFDPPQDCGDVFCSLPLVSSPLGTPCSCVYPMQVVIDVGVDSYVLFNLVQQLEVDVAAGTFLKQSQVKIVEAHASSRGPGRTRVSLDLVPLGAMFDNYTAFLIFDRLWQKKVPLDKHTFHDYDVISVQYPGLPSSPPSSPSSSDGALASSPDGEDQQMPLTADVPLPNRKERKMNARIVSVLVLTTSLLIFACLAIVFFAWKLKKSGQPPSDSGPASPKLVRRPETNSRIPVGTTSSPPVLNTYPITVKTFLLSQLEKATDGFSSKKLLGEGGSSRVYHGTMEDGLEVAVKLLKRMDQDRDRESEFVAEVEMLSRLHHRNLVKLIGICMEGHRRCLVYELVRNGSVESHLHGVDKSRAPLDWDTRMKIALGAARALAYLHEDSNPRVIHRDFKASNVLLEEDYTPKVSDFGLAKEASEGNNHHSTRIMGTFGYVAPEYAMTGHLLIKSDVYSYGVVLLELLSGRKPVYISDFQDPENLVVWARPLLATKLGLQQLLDPSLKEQCELDTIARVAAVASMCVQADPSLRPFMGEVVQALKLICSSKEDVCEDSCSREEKSSSGPEYEEFRNWWSADDSIDEMPPKHSLLRNSSGPLKIKRPWMEELYKLRVSVSEHGQRSRSLGS